MSEQKESHDEDPLDDNSAETPAVYAISRQVNHWKFSRREFLELTAASAATLTALSCGVQVQLANPTPTTVPEVTNLPVEAPTYTVETIKDTPIPTDTEVPTDTPEPTATDTPTPEPTATNTQTASPTAIIYGKIKEGNVNLRKGPGTYYDKIGTVQKDDRIIIYGRTEDSEWLHIQTTKKLDAWIAASFVVLDFPIESIPIELDIPPAPTGIPGGVAPGNVGINYKLDGKTYHLPCGAPIPPGAVCTCNCVTVPTPCECDGACQCAGQSHYWYPN